MSEVMNRRTFIAGTAAIGGALALSARLAAPARATGGGNGPLAWTGSAGFSDTQGGNNWTYLRRPSAGGPFVPLVWDGSVAWRNGSADTPWVDADSYHPGPDADAARAWTAPMSGLVAITGTAFKLETGGGNGVVVSVQLNDTVLWSRTLQGGDRVGYSADADLRAVDIRMHDVLYFVVNNNGEYSYDGTTFDPTITYITSGSWNAALGFATTQGENNWYYEQRPSSGGSTFTALPQVTGTPSAWRGATNEPWVSSDAFHPGQNYDAVRTWQAPSSGTVAITGRAFKLDTSPNGNGVIVSVQLNDSVKWRRTIAPTDGVGYTVDADLSAVAVNAGDRLRFVVNNNGDYGWDETGFDPTITYTTAPTWDLVTADTAVRLTVWNDRPVLLALTNPAQGWNWLRAARSLPLPDKVYVGGVSSAPGWTFQGGTVSTSNGTTLTLTFASSAPNLQLVSAWHADGTGPVQNSVSVQNNTGSDMSVCYADIRPADLTLTSDAAPTLWRFNRSNVRSSNDPNFDIGVLRTSVASYTAEGAKVSNDTNAGDYQLPFTMLDSGGDHGCYLGYAWPFGLISHTSVGDALQVYSTCQVGGSSRITKTAGSALALPTMYFGAYQGDTDAGSNSMKSWFYANAMTPTLRANASEPQVEYGIDLYSESDITAFFGQHDISSWGVELMKEDYLWTTDAGSQNPPFGDMWTPDPVKWPNGMTLGTIAHNNNVELSLYMANTYQGADLATDSGVASEIAALDYRYANWHFDYWRSDIYCEATGNYGSHQGFLTVIDHMINTYPGFRWENCSAGGSKKSFDLMQRMTVMTTEDSGATSSESVINYRKAYYANSYMIPPVQLKDDNAFPFPYNDSGTANYVFRTGFLGAWMFGCIGNQVTAVTDYMAAVSLYKSRQRPILRGADVYHILPMPDNISWDGMQFFNRTLNQGSVILFHPSAAAPSSQAIVLKGLDPAASYVLSFVERTSQNTTMTGAELMSTGITVTGMTGDLASEIIWIN